MPLKHREQSPPDKTSRKWQPEGAKVKPQPAEDRKVEKRKEQPGPQKVSSFGNVVPQSVDFAWNNQFIDHFKLLEAQLKGLNETKQISRAKRWTEIAHGEVKALISGHEKLLDEYHEAGLCNVHVDSDRFRIAVDEQKGYLKRLKLDVIDKVGDNTDLACEHDDEIRTKLREISRKARRARYKYVEELQEAIAKEKR